MGGLFCIRLRLQLHPLADAKLCARPVATFATACKSSRIDRHERVRSATRERRQQAMSKKNETAPALSAAGTERRLMTRRQAAEVLGVSPATLSRWAAKRTGPPFVKLHHGEAGTVRYPSDLLAAFLESRITQPKG
jgi:predicted DNA-binding transcriptional regulator AlpA